MNRGRNDNVLMAALTLRLKGKTYAEIGNELGFTRQRAQQILSPGTKAEDRIIARAGGCCESCGIEAGRSGQIHHRQAIGMPAETYHSDANLLLLCTSCHKKAHPTPNLSGVDWAEFRRKRTPEEKTVNNALRGIHTGAATLGISPEEYERHRLNGERWCSPHAAWEPSDQVGKRGRCADGNRLMVKKYQNNETRRDYYARNRERLAAYQREYAQRRKARAS